MTKEEAINLVIRVFDTLEGECNIEYDWRKEHEARDMAIKALEQESVSREVYDHEYFLRKELELKIAKLESVLAGIEKEINSSNRGTCDYFIVDRIEDIIDKYKAGSEE